jgi:hypothetical protein
MIQEIVDNFGPWLTTLNGASGTVAGAAEAAAKLMEAFQGKASLASEQEQALKVLPKQAPAEAIVRALSEGLPGIGTALAHARGGDGGTAKSLIGAATGGAGGAATAISSGGDKASGK